MKLQTYAIYDSVAKVFSQPFTAANNAVATRMFSNTASDPSTNIFKNPTDYSLHHIGEYDDEVGVLSSVAQTNLGLAAQYQPK